MAEPDHEKEETPDPDTAAMDGRRKVGAYIGEDRPKPPEVQENFYRCVAQSLSMERIEAYGSDCASSTITLSRYLLNIALCESLYPQLQLCEVALRNSIHRYLRSIFGRDDWFDDDQFPLTIWAKDEVKKSKEKIIGRRKPATAGRVVAELQFGFWTSLFEDHYDRHTRFLPGGIKGVFPYMPKSLHNRKDIKFTLEEIRTLRNRVFHHERIVHWKDLERRHTSILTVLGWIKPELQRLAESLDRFTKIREDGLEPWIKKICSHWPDR